MRMEKPDHLNHDRLWDWLWDVLWALRRIRKSPGFALTVVLTLALGIGVNLAVFELLHGVLLARLPVERPEQLYSLHAVQSPFDAQWIFSRPAYERLREAGGERSPVIARSGFGSGVLQASNGFSERARFQLVSTNFFAVLGLQPATGRFFAASDDVPDQTELPVVLRYGYAKEHFGVDASLIGRRAVLNRVPVVVVGVAPERFTGVVEGSEADVWLPLEAQSTGRFGSWFDSLGPGYEENLGSPYRSQPAIFWLWVMARVPDEQKGAMAVRWRQAIDPDLRLMAQATRDVANRERILRANVQLVPAGSGEGDMSRQYARPLLLLMAMAALVFLAGCLNLANLQLARLVGRQREIAMRIALGSSRWRLLRMLLLEDLLLALAGAAAALATCRAASMVLLHWASGRGEMIPVDLHMGMKVALTGAAMMSAALVCFSVLPAWRTTRSNFAVAMKTGVGSANTQSRQSRWWANMLLAAQVSLSLLLLGMATLFAASLVHLRHADAGLDREHVLSVHLDLRNSGMDERQLATLDTRVVERLKSLREVRDAAVQMCRIPNCVWNTAIHVFGHPELSDAQIHGEENHVGVSYFRTLGIPLLRGRVFAEEDDRERQPVVILNHAYARQLFGAENPIGHSVGYKPAPGDHTFLVVGEAGDARVDGVRAAAPPVAYFPIKQWDGAAGTIEVRVQGSQATAAADMRQALRAIDPTLPVTEIVSLNAEFEDGFATEKLLARLTSIFAGLTLALASIGFYGLLSFQVARRTSEIGIRMALGATRARVYGVFLRQTLGITMAGIFPGAAITLLVARTARSVLYGTEGSDGWVVLTAALVLLLVGMLATVIPARRAANVDPVRALSAE